MFLLIVRRYVRSATASPPSTYVSETDYILAFIFIHMLSVDPGRSP